MEDLNPLQLESERLILKTISLEYKWEIFAEFTSDITTYMFPKPAENLKETECFIKNVIRHWENGIDLTLVILKKVDLEFLGICSLHRLCSDTPEFGIWLKKSAHGHRFGREAIHCLKSWAEDNLDCDYFTYTVDKQNIPSRKIPESLGGRVVRSFQQMNLSGTLLDLLVYRIDKA